MTGIYTGCWIEDGWIYSKSPAINAKYWIDSGHIFGPVGAGTGYAVRTGYSIDGEWIYGPLGGIGHQVQTGFWIANGGHIFGPSGVPPFVQK